MTPIGPYNPDWAILAETNAGEYLYLVQETKSIVGNDDLLRKRETQKIACARQHSAAIDVRYDVTTFLIHTLRRPTDRRAASPQRT